MGCGLLTKEEVKVVARVSIYKSLLESARDRAMLSDDELAVVRELIEKVPAGMQRVELDEYPEALIRALLEDSKLKPNQRAVVALQLHGFHGKDVDLESLYSVEVAGPLEFGSAVAMGNRERPNVEFRWNGRWYPVVATAEFQEDEQKLAKIVYVAVTLDLGKDLRDLRWHVSPAIFVDSRQDPRSVTVLEVLQELGFRKLQTAPAAHNMRLVRAERLAALVGTQVWVKGKVLELQSRFWFHSTLNERPLGSEELPRRAVVEPMLGGEREDIRGYGFRQRVGGSVSRLPLVRVFSLDIKSYVYADIDDLVEYEYDATAIDRLVLPSKMKEVLATLFGTPTGLLFGDVVRGKHGGIVILASGNPGVGKTLTAEVYAEIARRPLYVLEFGEIGTTVKEIEEQLESIFARVVRWHAVLQFDECEIFLSQRGDDLERSAIVGIFLRMLDYYEGLLFLTTNRPDTLDYAIRSRVMLRLEYPDLDHAARERIWRTMFAAAGLELSRDDFKVLAESETNGRQIRNLVRLARILHADRKITLEQMQGILEYGCR